MNQRRRILEIVSFMIAGGVCGLLVGIVLVGIASRASCDEKLRELDWVETHVDQER